MVEWQESIIDCEACKEDSPPASDIEITDFLAECTQWSCESYNDIRLIVRDYPFKNFAQALEFTNLIGHFAEKNQHHPSILTEWGRVSLSFWTHKIGNLHRLDLMMARHCDRIFEQVHTDTKSVS